MVMAGAAVNHFLDWLEKTPRKSSFAAIFVLLIRGESSEWRTSQIFYSREFFAHALKSC